MRFRPVAAEYPLLADVLAEIEELVTAPGNTARYLVTRIALAAQSALLVQHAPTVVADAFIASRLGSGWGPGYGTLRGFDFQAIIDFGRLEQTAHGGARHQCANAPRRKLLKPSVCEPGTSWRSCFRGRESKPLFALKTGIFGIKENRLSS